LYKNLLWLIPGNCTAERRVCGAPAGGQAQLETARAGAARSPSEAEQQQNESLAQVTGQRQQQKSYLYPTRCQSRRQECAHTQPVLWPGTAPRAVLVALPEQPAALCTGSGAVCWRPGQASPEEVMAAVSKCRGICGK